MARRARCQLSRIFLHTDLRSCTQMSDLAHRSQILHIGLPTKRSSVCDQASAPPIPAHLLAHRSQILHTKCRSCTQDCKKRSSVCDRVTRRARLQLPRIFLHTDLRSCTQVSDLAHKCLILHTGLPRKRSIACCKASVPSIVAWPLAHRSQILHTSV